MKKMFEIFKVIITFIFLILIFALQ